MGSNPLNDSQSMSNTGDRITVALSWDVVWPKSLVSEKKRLKILNLSQYMLDDV